MGTTGSGRLTDYPGSNKQGSGTGSSGNSGGGETDKCGRAFTVILEDIERSSYYINHEDLPEEGARLTIGFEKRIVAVAEDGLTVGNLPTSYNYLAACIKDGYSYIGYVSGTTNIPIATVTADFAPVSA